MSSSSKTTTSSSQTNPWAPQSDQLKFAFGEARDAYGQASQAQAPDNFVAGYTPDQLSAFGKMLGYGTNTNAAATSQNVGQGLSDMGLAGVGAGMDALKRWAPTNTPQNTVAAASLYGNNPYTQGMVDAAMRGAQRSVTENVLPQISRNAQAGGNVNSNRTAIQEGIVGRGYQDAYADTASKLMGDLYSQGLTTAAQQQYGADAMSLNRAQALTNAGNVAAGYGVNALGQSVNQQGNLFDIANKGIAGQYGAAQADLNNQIAQYQSGVSSPFAPLNSFWNIIGSNNWGNSSRGTNTTTSTPSRMSSIGQGVGVLG